MFYDLHVCWGSNLAEIQHTVSFLHELGYNAIALSHTLSGKLPADLKCIIPAELPFSIPKSMQILRRCTLILSDPSQNHRVSSLAGNYDILAIRPTNEKSLQQACGSLDCDIISIDLTARLESHLKMSTLSQAVERGIKLELCYSPGIMSSDNNARRNFISNATQLIRASRGRGIIISSEATRAAGCRSPWDVINLAAVWGLGQEKGKEAVSQLARSVVTNARLKRTSFRGAIDVVYGGERPAPLKEGAQTSTSGKGANKRKAESMDPPKKAADSEPITLSKREQKRRRKHMLEDQKTVNGNEKMEGADLKG